MAKAKQVKVETPVLFGSDVLDAHLSPAQADALNDFAGLVLEHDMARDTFAEQADALVRRIWAKPAPYDVWKPVVREMRYGVSQYAATCLREAYKRVHGALPTAGDKRATGKAKVSPRRWAAGFASEVNALTERLAAMPKDDVNAARMRKIAEHVAALARLIEAEREELAA